jgi:hypothetical protein
MARKRRNATATAREVLLLKCLVLLDMYTHFLVNYYTRSPLWCRQKIRILKTTAALGMILLATKFSPLVIFY